MGADLETLAFQAQYLLHTKEAAEKAASLTPEKKLLLAVEALKRIAHPKASIGTSKSEMVQLVEQVATSPMAMRGIAVEALERIGVSIWD